MFGLNFRFSAQFRMVAVAIRLPPIFPQDCYQIATNCRQIATKLSRYCYQIVIKLPSKVAIEKLPSENYYIVTKIATLIRKYCHYITTKLLRNSQQIATKNRYQKIALKNLPANLPPCYQQIVTTLISYCYRTT